jgi:hypothetical protein
MLSLALICPDRVCLIGLPKDGIFYQRPVVSSDLHGKESGRDAKWLLLFIGNGSYIPIQLL